MNRILAIIMTLAVSIAIALPLQASATEVPDDGDALKAHIALADTVPPPVYEDSLLLDSIEMESIRNEMTQMADTFTMEIGKKRDWGLWRPNPKRAMWLAIIMPGAGQIYNRKFWKLPIVYGGFVGSLYALRWNNMMYRDYSQGYLDLADDNPETQSYNQFLHLGQTITDANRSTYENLFKRRKDYYRRYRDLSLFVLIGVYALSIIDAYVDASLSEFDISDDLSLRVAPAVINNGNTSSKSLHSAAFGLQCSLNF